MGITKDKKALILGIVMVVLGILLLTGSLKIGPWVVFGAAIVLIVLGVLMVAKTLPGGMLVGIVAIVLGALVILPNDLVPDNDVIETILGVIDLVIGVLLIVFGVLKIIGK